MPVGYSVHGELFNLFVRGERAVAVESVRPAGGLLLLLLLPLLKVVVIHLRLCLDNLEDMFGDSGFRKGAKSPS